MICTAIAAIIITVVFALCVTGLQIAMEDDGRDG